MTNLAKELLFILVCILFIPVLPLLIGASLAQECLWRIK